MVEEDILCLPPDYTIFPKVDLAEFDTDMEKCAIKCKWAAISEERKAEREKVLEEASEGGNGTDKEISNKFYDNVSKSLNFKNLRATVFTNNKRFILPKLEEDPKEIT